MCFYAVAHYKTHFVCVRCRVSFKRHWSGEREQHCPNCGRPMACAGHDFAAPRRRDVRGWSVVEVVLRAGLRYEGLSGCGCSKEPEYRPRTRAQVRARRAVAAREGAPLAEVLARPEPGVPVPPRPR
ncbi:hypothetical protein [Streptomyces sp. NPDC020983]|uniref:hypothetical protein n=1 Tax=Streptomyces sp. NPDC020983 TaxID=3365106 RepID=UPI0037B82699